MGRKHVIGLIAALVAIVTMAAPVWASDAEVLKEIQFLRQRLDKLEASLGHDNAQPTATQPATQQKVADKKVPAEQESSVRDIVKQVLSEENPVTISGAAEVVYSNSDWSDRDGNTGGTLKFNNFQLGFDSEYKDIIVSAQYRWYEYMDVIHHLYLGYNFTDNLQGQLGITKVPFGILPYSSHNWWYNLNYYVGLCDDYDTGAKLIYNKGPLNVQFAFFKNEEYGNSRTERYSFDVLATDDTNSTLANEETNQWNGRVAYTISHGDLGSTELGVSGEWGQLYNTVTKDNGDHWAAGIHLNGNYGPVNVQLQYNTWEYDPSNAPGADDNYVMMGAFADSFQVAAKADMYEANISYELPVNWGPIESLTFYNDYSQIVKDKSSWNDSQMNITGCMIGGGNTWIYVDLIQAKNAPWIGSGTATALSSGAADEWQTMLNVVFGYYF